MWCVAAWLLLAATAYGAAVSGTVYLQESSTIRPLAGVRITVRQAEGAAILGSATTDSQGRYQVESLPRTRVQVNAARPGFFAHARRGGEPAVVVDLDAAADFAGADFEAQPGGVVSGRVTDARGDPVQEAQIHLFRVTDFGGRHRHVEQSIGSDDRGQYRAFGLEPGRYLLEVATPQSDWLPDRRSPVYYPGTSDMARATEIEVHAGDEVTGIDITLRPEPVFQVSGRIVGVQASPLQPVILRLASSIDQFNFTFASPDGTFAFPRVPRGRYLLTARGPQGMITSEPLELSADVTNLTLRQTEPGQITGRVAFSGSGTKPAEIRLRARAVWQNPLETVARAPDYRFQFDDIWAGPHVLEIASSEAYVSKMKLGTKDVPARLDVPPGGITGLELTVGFGVAQVTGMIKAPRGGPLPQARVALARPGTNPVEFRTAIADQNGRFVLSSVRPGEYLLGAWATAPVEQLYGPEIWGHKAVKRLTVEPRAQVELDLTAIP